MNRVIRFYGRERIIGVLSDPPDLDAKTTSGQRSKDFIDVYYLLNTTPLNNMLECYKAKYDRENISHILKSLIYFDEVDLVDWPFLIREPTLKWDSVKKRIEQAVLDDMR